MMLMAMDAGAQSDRRTMQAPPPVLWHYAEDSRCSSDQEMRIE
jgi:hypothetical protein